MAFLTLNGWQIPISRGGERSPIVIGEDSRAFDGTLMRDRRVVKDQWRFETKGIPAEDATALVGMLLGRGDVWSFDAADLYSGKGFGAISPYNKVALRPGNSLAPVAAILNQNDVPEAKFGNALTVEPPCTNLLPTDQRRCTNAASFSLIGGGSKGTSTTYAAIATGETTPTSVFHTRTALNQGVSLNPTLSVTDSLIYNVSAYVMSPVACTITLDAQDDDNEGVSISKAVVANTWYHFASSFQTGGSATILDLRFTVTAGAAAGTIYIDGLQVTLAATFYSDNFTWVDGADATADSLVYPGSPFTNASGLTFAAWVRMGSTNYGSQRYLFGLTGPTSAITLLRNSTNAFVAAYIVTPGGNTYQSANTAAPWSANAWRHVALTVGRDPRTGATFGRHYLDGVADGTFALTAPPEFANMEYLAFGSYAGGSASIMGNGALMDDAVVLPYVLPTAAIAALAAKAYAMPSLPKLLAAGDAVQGLAGSALVEGRVATSTYAPGRLAGLWHDNEQRVRFELET